MTLEPDVAAQVERRRHDSHSSLKSEVNRLLRLGLEVDRESSCRTIPERFRVEPFAVGELLIEVDDVTAALEIAELQSQS
ncbi:MAG TPA: hypothetical protein VGO48_11785 [Conexibacter sp.]|nr:hypothetical protein [Conexibacter sp.]